MALTARLFDAQGGLVTNGLIDKITSFNYSDRLDEVGTFDLRLPLAYARSKKYIDAATTIAVSEDFEEFFRGTIDSAERSGGEYLVSGSDLIAELRYPEVGGAYAVNGSLLPDVIDSIIAYTEQTWTANTSTQSLPVVAEFNGKSVFDALRELNSTYGLHMRRLLPDVRSVQIGSFGAASGYVLTNLASLSESARGRNTAAIIGPPQTKIDRSQVVNRVIAYGSGTLKLPLYNRVGTSTAIHVRTRGDAIEHYIENSASISKYGVREKVVRFGEITSASSETADIERAEDALLARAEAFLTRWGLPITTHQISSANFNRLGCRVGDTLTMRYEESAGDDTVISINDEFYLTEVAGSFNQSGEVMYRLTLADTNRVITDDTEALVATIKRLEELKLEDLT
jgi:hypothetical protein